MEAYLFLWNSNKRVRLCEQSGCPIIVDGRSLINIGKPVERMWIYWLYGDVDSNGEQYIKLYLKSKYKWITDEISVEIIESFKKDHQPEEVLSYNIDLLNFEWTEIFTSKGYVLPIPFYESEIIADSFKITPAREREITKLILSSKGNNEFNKIKGWFNKYKREHFEVWSRKDIVALSVATAMQYGVPIESYMYDINMENMKQDEKMSINESEIKIAKEKQVVPNYSEITEGSYMYFDYNKTVIPLFNSKKYVIKLENGIKIKILPEDERILAAYLGFSDDEEKSKTNICTWLNYEYENLPYHLHDSFISKFINEHPQTQVEFSEIPVHAVDGLYTLAVPSLDEKIIITEAEEKELIEILKVKKEKSLGKIRDWFVSYYYKHGESPLSFYNDIETIAESFMADKGFIAPPSKIDVVGTYLLGFAVIFNILVYIFLAVVTVMFLFFVYPTIIFVND